MPSCLPRPAFTLTELLVAIALLLIILVAASTVFRTAGQTVGMGIAMTDQNRALATTGRQFQQDIIGYSDTDPYVIGSGMYPVNETPGPSAPPFLFIRNYSQSSFHDKAAADAGTAANFRLDSMGMFVRGAFKRQTGTIYTAPANSPLVDDMSVFTKAYVWYGHVRLTGGAAMNPGEAPVGNNPNNYYANQWILGRRAILLADVIQPPATPPGTVLNSYGVPVAYYARAWNATATPVSETWQWDPTDFAPLGRSGQATFAPSLLDSAVDINQQITESRYDIAALNREQNWSDYANLLQTYQTRFQAGTFGPNYATGWTERNLAFAIRPLASPTEAMDLAWNQSTDASNKLSFANAAALSVPVLLRGCTNFVVEFAGDYVDQNPATGAVLSSVTFDVNELSTWHLDGVIDFDIINGRQQIHWYGLGDTAASDRTVKAMRGTAMPFELAVPSAMNRLYSCGWTRDMLYLPATALVPPIPRPSLAPKLIRITVQVSDPQGRVLDDMTRQFVFPVKYY